MRLLGPSLFPEGGCWDEFALLFGFIKLLASGFPNLLSDTYQMFIKCLQREYIRRCLESPCPAGFPNEWLWVSCLWMSFLIIAWKAILTRGVLKQINRSLSLCLQIVLAWAVWAATGPSLLWGVTFSLSPQALNRKWKNECPQGKNQASQICLSIAWGRCRGGDIWGLTLEKRFFYRFFNI